MRLERATFGLGRRGVDADATEERENIGSADPPSSPIVEGHGQSVGNGTPSVDPGEAALADALTKASAAGQWTVVAALAGELEARRKARAGVVELDAERRKRERGG